MSYIDEVRDQLTLKVQEHFRLSEKEANLAGAKGLKQRTERQDYSRRLQRLNNELLALSMIVTSFNKDLERESRRPTPTEVTASTAA